MINYLAKSLRKPVLDDATEHVYKRKNLAVNFRSKTRPSKNINMILCAMWSVLDVVMIRKLYERVYDRGGKDKKLHMLKHSYEKHANVLLKIPDTGKWILKEYLQMKTFENPFCKRTVPFTKHARELISFETFQRSQ